MDLEDPSAYNFAVNHGFLSKIYLKLGIASRWTLLMCKEDALKYKRRSDWANNKGGGYAAAIKNGWLDECCKHMTSKLRWTLERCKEDALKYKTKIEWRNISTGYSTANKNGWMDECCKHMISSRNPSGYWTLERCKEDALKYKTKKKWAANSSAQSAAQKNGWTEECCRHMAEYIKPNFKWSLKKCKEDALKYETKIKWIKHSTAYHTAWKNGWLVECSKHFSK